MKINEVQKLHKLYIVYQAIALVKAFWPIYLIGTVRIGFSIDTLVWIIGIAVAVILLGLVYSYISWKKFSFVLLEDRIIIRSGVLFRDEKTIYYGRIHSVNVQQKILHRLLGIAQVMIETPGGKGKSDGVLSALSRSYANELAVMLRNQQLHAQQQTESGYVTEEQMELGTVVLREANIAERESKEAKMNIKLTSGQLFKAAATSLNFGLALAFMGALYSFGNQFLTRILPDEVINEALANQSWLRSGLLIIAILTLAIVVLVWLLSLLLYVIKYSGFTIKEQQQQLLISYGLFEKKTFVIDPGKVQAVMVKQSWLRKPLGYVEIGLQVVTAEKKERLVLHPFILSDQVNGLLQQFIPKFALPNNEGINPAPKRALLYYWRTPMIILLAMIGGLYYFFPDYAGWAFCLVPIVWIIMWLRYRTAGVLLEEQQLVLRFGSLTKTICLIHRPQIMALSVTRSRGQRRKQLLTITAHTLGAEVPLTVKCLDEQHVSPVWLWYSRNK